MTKIIKGLLEKQSIRYILAGGCTTLVNLICFTVLRKLIGVNLNLSNFLAIILSIMFAYYVNRGFVFKAVRKHGMELVAEITSFFSGRAVTMVIEIIGVFLLVGSLRLNEFLAKFIIQFVVLILNFFISKLFVFQEKKITKRRPRSFKEWMGDNYVYVFAFVIPFVFLVLICIIFGVSPFGDRSLVIIDGLHQYMPFFSEYQNKLLNNESMLYTWNGGLGMNFLALWAYYLSSPLNILIVLFKQEYLNTAVSFLIILKIALSGFTFAYYLIHRIDEPKIITLKNTLGTVPKIIRDSPRNFQGQSPMIQGQSPMTRGQCPNNQRQSSNNQGQSPNNQGFPKKFLKYLKPCPALKFDHRILIFSTCYALSNYMIGYSWNVMWLDSIALFPLILLGMDYLIKKNDGRLYCVTLFLSLYCNFYISFMTCIFLIIWYLLYRHKSIKLFLKKGFIFAGYSLLAAGLAAVVLMPTFQGIMMTSSAKSTFPKWETYTSFFDILSAHMAFVTPLTNLQNDGGVNLFCGILSVFLLVLYIFDRKTALITRLKRILILIFLVISFNTTVLNYIWHGFHDQYGIPNRFAYIYIFLILIMAYDVLTHIKSFPKIYLFWSYGICIGFLILSFIYAKERESYLSYGITIALLTIYFILLLLYKMKRLNKDLFHQILLGIVIIELCANGIFGYAHNGQIKISKFFADTTKMNQVKKELAKDEDLYRTELAKSKILDEVTWHNLKGINLFGSTAVGGVVSTMGKLGFYSAANEYLYKGVTPVTNSFLGVKYLIVRKGDANYSGFTYQKTIEDIDIYQNQYALPFGFMTNSTVKEWVYRLNNPFHVQNNLAASVIDHPLNIYTSLVIEDPISTNGCEIKRRSSGEYSFTNTSSQQDNVVYEIIPTQDQDLYLHIVGNQIESIMIKNGEQLRANEKLNSQVIHVGEVKAGVPVTISLKLKYGDQNSGTIGIMAAAFNQTAFQSFYDQLADEGLMVESYTSDYIKGSVNVKKDGVFLTSIPYDGGWKVKVDGKEMQTYAIAEAFTAFDLEKGYHDITFHYQPSGMYAGIGITTLSFFILCFVWRWKRKS